MPDPETGTLEQAVRREDGDEPHEAGREEEVPQTRLGHTTGIARFASRPAPSNR